MVEVTVFIFSIFCEAVAEESVLGGKNKPVIKNNARGKVLKSTDGVIDIGSWLSMCFLCFIRESIRPASPTNIQTLVPAVKKMTYF